MAALNRWRALRDIGALSLSIVIAPCGQEAGSELVFKVPLQRIPRLMQGAYQGLSPRDSVELQLEGEWFDPPRALTVIPRAAADRSTPVSASQAAYSAFKQADDDWIVASFAEGDRPDIREFLSNAAVRDGSRRYYETIRGKQVHGWARYSVGDTEYRLVFVTLTHADTSERMETFVLEDGEWRRTNRLVRDRAFQVAWSAFRHGSVTPE